MGESVCLVFVFMPLVFSSAPFSVGVPGIANDWVTGRSWTLGPVEGISPGLNVQSGHQRGPPGMPQSWGVLGGASDALRGPEG